MIHCPPPHSGFLQQAVSPLLGQAQRPQRERVFEPVALVPPGPPLSPAGSPPCQEARKGIFRGQERLHRGGGGQVLLRLFTLFAFYELSTGHI